MTEEDRVWRIGYVALYLFGTVLIVTALAVTWDSSLDVWQGILCLLSGCLLAYLAALWHGSAVGHPRKIVRRALWVFFGLYSALLISSTFLDGLFFRGAGSLGMNLLPFRTIRDVYITSLRQGTIPAGTAILNLAGNLLLLAPLALFLPFAVKAFKKWWTFSLTAAGISALIELGQLVLHRGCCDIDDLILNTVGAVGVFAVLKIPPLSRAVARITMEDRTE